MRSNGAPRRSWAGEKLLPLSELSRELHRIPDSPVRRSHWALRRWVIDGSLIHGTKKRVRLACTVLFGARHSSVEAVREFIALLTGEVE